MSAIAVEIPSCPDVVVMALVDAEDRAYLDQLRWTLNPEGYAVRYGIRGRTVRMHREILDAPDDLEVDHINGNRLDNRKANLRLATHRENQQNRRGANRNGRSRYRGVSPCKETGRWKATVMLDGKQHWLGRHDTEEAAARACEAFRAEHMPFSSDRVSNNNTTQEVTA